MKLSVSKDILEEIQIIVRSVREALDLLEAVQDLADSCGDTSKKDSHLAQMTC